MTGSDEMADRRGALDIGPRHERWIYPHTFPCYGLLVTPAADPGAPIRLRFALKDADLYSLRFR